MIEKQTLSAIPTVQDRGPDPYLQIGGRRIKLSDQEAKILKEVFERFYKEGNDEKINSLDTFTFSGQ